METNSVFTRDDGFFKLDITMEAEEGYASPEEHDIDKIVNLFKQHANSQGLDVRGVSADTKEDLAAESNFDI